LPGAYFLIALTAQNLVCRADAPNVYIYCVEGAGDTDFEQFQVFRPTGTSTSPILLGESVRGLEDRRPHNALVQGKPLSLLAALAPWKAGSRQTCPASVHTPLI
jgi:hypothetical protein